MAPISNAAVFATLLMNDAYLPGAMVLAHSLRDRRAKGKLVCFVVLQKLADETITELKTVYDEIVPVQQIINRYPTNLYLMDRPDLISTFTKIELWKQTQYSRIVYMDADMVAIRAPNELLTMDTHFAAVPDIGWPDCFNSGLLVLNPNMADYYALLALAERGISFDGADQGLLNMHFTDWERLSFVYNCTPSGNYQYVPAYKHFQSSIQIVHFIGKQKPWHQGRHSSTQGGVYGELLGRWWAVYDAHYRAQETVYYTGSWQPAPKKVQDHVAGEETIYLPGYRAPVQSHPPPGQAGHPPPAVVVHSPAAETTVAGPATEQPLGDQPATEEQIRHEEFTPVPTVEQRRWSAPHVEWEPARAPPPVNSKPEASNFPSTTYEMSASRDLFQAPTSYPEAPKGMWYEVPQKVAPAAKPKAIFPWETKAPPPTRVFAQPSAPSPPPEPAVPVAAPEVVAEPDASRTSSTSATTSTADTTETADTTGTTVSPAEPYIDPWTTFHQRTNAWDEMPDISRYMQAFTQAKKGKIQVLHHTPSVTAIGGSHVRPGSRGRRESLIITDFPTAVERPSLPVTPAPIRRPTFWGEERDEGGDLPVADGVPKQNEWVRRLSSYPKPEFAALPPFVQEINGVVCFTCQHCGQQNPIAKLDELQRRQSAALLSTDITTVAEPPLRAMPESVSKEAVAAATEAAISLAQAPLRPILKEPKFGIPASAETSTEDSEAENPAPDSSRTIVDIAGLEENLSPASTPLVTQ